jgi:hypothetical protein
MRSRRTKSVAAAVVVAVFATGWVLSAAMRLTPKAGAAQEAQDDGDSGVVLVERLPDAVEVSDKPASLDVGDGSPATSVGLRSAEVVDGAVHVVGKATAYDPRPNTKYIWGIRILGAAHEETLLEKLYDDNILSVPDDGNLKSDFDEFLSLPFDSGTYILELAWYAIPPDTGLEGLNVTSVREFNRSLGGRTEISLDQ